MATKKQQHEKKRPMSQKPNVGNATPRPTQGNATPPSGTSDATKEPAAERGERVETGKQISRGGHTAGNVPGATEEKR